MTKTKHLLAAAILALAPALAHAQDRDDRRDRDRRGGEYHHDERGSWGDRHDWRDHRDWDGHRWEGGRYPAFVYPDGYGYRRWGIGAFLPSVFLGSGYYFNDYYRFGFAPPPYGFRWVRNGPDLLLVNVRDGRIRDVRYGVFG